MKLANLFRRRDPAAVILYGQIVDQARRPEFYRVCGVADSVQGRFEMIAMHLFLVLYRLKREGRAGAALAQDLFDIMFQDMDRNLRELGTGDLAVGKRIKSLAKGLYGRIAAYERGLAPCGPGQDAAGGLADLAGESLEEALRRNVFAEAVAPPAALGALADYLRRAAASLGRQPLNDLAAGRLTFTSPPAGAASDEPRS